MPMYPLLNFRAYDPLRKPKIVVSLQAHPNFGRDAEILAKSQRGIGRDSPLTVDDGTNAAGRYRGVTGKLINADAKRLHELLE